MEVGKTDFMTVLAAIDHERRIPLSFEDVISREGIIDSIQELIDVWREDPPQDGDNLVLGIATLAVLYMERFGTGKLTEETQNNVKSS